MCAMKKAHGQRAQPHLDALRAGVASLDGLHAQLDAVEAEAAACRVAIEGKKAKLEAARRALEAAPGSEQAVFERAIAAAAATVAGGGLYIGDNLGTGGVGGVVRGPGCLISLSAMLPSRGDFASVAE